MNNANIKLNNANNSDSEVKTFLMTRLSASIRNSGDVVYITRRADGISALYGLGLRTDAEQIKRVLGTLSRAELERINRLRNR